jgi:hypothetical protein
VRVRLAGVVASGGAGEASGSVAGLPQFAFERAMRVGDTQICSVPLSNQMSNRVANDVSMSRERFSREIEIIS